MSALPILDWDQAYNRNGDGKLPRAVVNVIRTYMDNHTLDGFVKQQTVAEATGMTVRGVRKQIAANVNAGWLQIAEPGDSSKATVYRLTYPKAEPQFRLDRGAQRRNHSSSSTAEGGTTVPGSAPEGGTTVPADPEPQFRPTTPRTSPQEKFSTTPRTGNSSSPFGEPEIPGPEGSAMEAEPDTAEGPEKAPPAESTDQVGASARDASPSHDRARSAGSDSTSIAATSSAGSLGGTSSAGADRRSSSGRDRPRPVGRDPFAEAPPAGFDDDPPW